MTKGVLRGALRGTPKVGDIVLINDKCIGNIHSLEWDSERVRILKGELNKGEPIRVVIVLNEDDIEKLRNTRPHLFI